MHLKLQQRTLPKKKKEAECIYLEIETPTIGKRASVVY